MKIARIAASALLTLVAIAVAACGDARPAATPTPPPAETVTATPTSSTFPMTITDSGGASVTLKAPARAIVSHSPGATEILFAIGAGSQVVAADEFSNYPAAAQALKKVKYSDPSPEAEVALQPDLVILATNQKAAVEPFRRLGLPVFFNQEPDSLAGVLANVRLLGRVTGHTGEAEELATRMQQRMDAVASKVADVREGPKVFYELSDSLFTAAPQTFIGGMISTLKGRNIAAGSASPFPQLTAEAVIAAGPEVILLANAKYGGSPEQLRARPGWDAIPAVKSGRMHAIDPDLVNRPGPRVVEGLEMMAKLLYPERFR